MTTENIAAAVPRLEALRVKLGGSVCLTLEVWCRKTGVDVEWSIWDGANNHVGRTIDEALKRAEGAILSAVGPLDAVIMPEGAPSRASA